MDWNWFFSTFAQCSAAIVGLIGAFAISKIVDLTSKVYECRQELASLSRIRVKLFSKINQANIPKYNKKIILTKKIKNAVFNGIFDSKSDKEIYGILEQKYGVYPNDEEIFDHFNKLYGKYLLKETDDEKMKSRKVSNRNLLKQMKYNINYDFKPSKENIENLRREISEYQSELTKYLLNFTPLLDNIHLIRRIILFLIIGFFILVIYPLHFLPIEINNTPHVGLRLSTIIENILSVGGFLLIAFSFILTSIAIVFLRSLQKLEEQLVRYQSIADNDTRYDEYLRYFAGDVYPSTIEIPSTR